MADGHLDLETFRKRWKEELTGSNTKSTTKPSGVTPEPAPSKPLRRPSVPHPVTGRKEEDDFDEELVPQQETAPGTKYTGYASSVTQDDVGIGSSKDNEPKSALEHYEKAVERETQGSLGDSLNLYRKAYRLDPKVDKTYKNKYFPPTSSTPANPNPSNASVTVPNPAHHSLEEPEADLVQEYTGLSILGAPPPIEGTPAPPCPISTLPSEVLIEILTKIALIDVAAFVRLAQVCKLFDRLIGTEENIWKQVCLSKEFGFAGMHYTFVVDNEGLPVYQLEPSPRPAIVPTVSWKHTFHTQPRMRFTGVYISTVNYSRPGASSPSQVSWNTPVHIVTYYRYLRFFRDGTCISLLTTTEPSEVVQHLTKENAFPFHESKNSQLPSDHKPVYNHSIVKSFLRGRWYLSDPSSDEGPGELHVETEGVDVKYMYSLHLALRSVRTPTTGGGPKNTKLVWKGFWSYNRLTDDWAEFGLRNDRAFFFSTVRSYGMGR